MSHSQLISLLVKQIAGFYQARLEVDYQIEQATMQKQAISERIDTLEKAVYCIEPAFDFRQIQTQFNPIKLSRQKRFHHDVSYLIAKVLNEHLWYL